MWAALQLSSRGAKLPGNCPPSLACPPVLVHNPTRCWSPLCPACSWKLYATRSARDLSYLFLCLYCVGCLLSFVYL